MDRRQFFNRMIGGLAATAAARAWPFRVYSFPTEIVIAPVLPAGFVTLELLQEAFKPTYRLLGGVGHNVSPSFPRQQLLPWQDGYVSHRQWVDELPDVNPKGWKRIDPWRGGE